MCETGIIRLRIGYEEQAAYLSTIIRNTSLKRTSEKKMERLNSWLKQARPPITRIFDSREIFEPGPGFEPRTSRSLAWRSTT